MKIRMDGWMDDEGSDEEDRDDVDHDGDDDARDAA